MNHENTIIDGNEKIAHGKEATTQEAGLPGGHCRWFTAAESEAAVDIIPGITPAKRGETAPRTRPRFLVRLVGQSPTKSRLVAPSRA